MGWEADWQPSRDGSGAAALRRFMSEWLEPTQFRTFVIGLGND